MHQSIATIDSPEFINLQPLDINPLMSSCEIKVMYLGENRNHSFISKEVAYEMAKTLRGAPIVGYYKKETEDFGDHGQRVIIDDEGIKFECLTKPYGFVSPDAKVWFQKFEDTDDFGNKIIREYMMTTGFLWTGQFEECKLAVEGDGRPHSMELDEKTIDGHWSTNLKSNMEFFIINDAIFSKLCILGENVEPCFEGSSVTSPKVSASFTKIDDDFKNTLFTMMQDLKIALEGGSQVDTENKINETLDNPEQSEINENQNSTEFSEQGSSMEVNENNETASQETEPTAEFVADNTSEDDGEGAAADQFAKKDDEEEKKDEDSSDTSESNEGEQEDKEDEEEDEKNKKYALLEAEYTQLKENYEKLQINFNELQTNYQTLVEFKNAIEEDKKDEMIGKFYMLSDEDKKDIINNKANYTIEEIEEKLSVICFRKKINFDLEEDNDTSKTTEQPVVTFNLSNEEEAIPAWLKAVDNVKNNKI